MTEKMRERAAERLAGVDSDEDPIKWPYEERFIHYLGLDGQELEDLYTDTFGEPPSTDSD